VVESRKSTLAAGTSGNDVQRTRAWTGLWVVVGGDVVIGVAAIIAVARMASGSGNEAAMVSILTSAFTAIATMTTAYFGIKSMSNTAQSTIAAANLGSGPNPTPRPSMGGPPPSNGPVNGSGPETTVGNDQGSQGSEHETPPDSATTLEQAARDIDPALEATAAAIATLHATHEEVVVKQTRLRERAARIKMKLKTESTE
jgi:hypothetical protein